MRPAALVLLLALAACAERSAAPRPEARVGSKAFTESVVLGELAAQALQGAGARVSHRRALGGTRLVWEALVRGELDVYPEYTGTLREEVFAGQGLEGPGALEAALARAGVRMGAPLGFNNTYALGVREDVAGRLGLERVSDLARHPALRLGLSHEFLDRKDGWGALAARYRLPQRAVHGLDHDLAYRALADGHVDVTDVYTTDAELQAYRVRVLEDDLGFFPRYDAVWLYRADWARAHPELERALAALAGRLDEGRMVRLNARAKLERVPEPRVARDALAELGLSRGAARAQDGVAARVGARTREHLGLVGLALLFALAAGVPLGVLAARRPRLGQAVLAATGLVQTIPALALLVLLVPPLGIGLWPALAALALYSLLPVVRGTALGLTGIPAELREAALALGLTPRTRLWRVELPLALPALLAGAQTSAVIAVGTATLGALVGAGGYGEPILSGVRLADTALLLEGALPAALLALLAHGAFELLARALVSPGLRLPPGGG